LPGFGLIGARAFLGFLMAGRPKPALNGTFVPANPKTFSVATGGAAGASMTDQLHHTDADLRNLARLVSACTLGLWAFALGLLIGTFLFS
jgi:hypothetical protein